ncbi:hypothetical protein SEVIR_9G211810v4 [Setaria viridis]
MGDRDGDRDRKRKGKMPAYEDDPNPYKRARLFAGRRGGGDGSSSSAGAPGAWRIPRAGAGNPGQDAPGSAPVVNLPHGHQQPGGSSFRDGHGFQLQAPASENLPPTAPRQLPPPQLAVQQLIQQYQAMQATNRRPMGQQHGGALGGSSFNFNHGHGLQLQAPASGDLPLQLQPRGDACVCPVCQNSRDLPCSRCLLERDPRQLHRPQLAVQQLLQQFEAMRATNRPTGQQHGGALGGSSFGFNHGHGVHQLQALALRSLLLVLQSRGSLQQAPQYQQIRENSRQLVFWLRRQVQLDRLYLEAMRQQLQNWRPVHQQPPQAPIPEVGKCPICDCDGVGLVSYHPWRHVCPCDPCNFAYRCEVCEPEQATVPATSGPPPPPQPHHQHPPRPQQHPQPPPPVGAGAQQLQNQPAVGQLGEAPGGYAAQVGHPVRPAAPAVLGIPPPRPHHQPPPPVGASVLQLQNQPAVGIRPVGQLGEAPGGYAAQVGHPVAPAESAPCWGCGLFLAPVNPQPSSNHIFQMLVGGVLVHAGS